METFKEAYGHVISEMNTRGVSVALASQNYMSKNGVRMVNGKSYRSLKGENIEFTVQFVNFDGKACALMFTQLEQVKLMRMDMFLREEYQRLDNDEVFSKKPELLREYCRESDNAFTSGSPRPQLTFRCFADENGLDENGISFDEYCNQFNSLIKSGLDFHEVNLNDIYMLMSYDIPRQAFVASVGDTGQEFSFVILSSNKYENERDFIETLPEWLKMDIRGCRYFLKVLTYGGQAIGNLFMK